MFHTGSNHFNDLEQLSKGNCAIPSSEIHANSEMLNLGKKKKKKKFEYLWTHGCIGV